MFCQLIASIRVVSVKPVVISIHSIDCMLSCIKHLRFLLQTSNLAVAQVTTYGLTVLCSLRLDRSPSGK